MNKSDKVESYGDYPSPDYDYFYAKDNYNKQPEYPENRNNWNQNNNNYNNYPNNNNRNNPNGFNGVGPNNLFNFLENNFGTSDRGNYQGNQMKGPRSTEQQRANEYIN